MHQIQLDISLPVIITSDESIPGAEKNTAKKWLVHGFSDKFF